MDCREASVVPFHGSLFAFLRDRPDHQQAFLSLAANVLEWLEEESPEYWHRGLALGDAGPISGIPLTS